MENFGVRLAKLRKRKGYTQRKLAHILNIPESTFRNWEHGVIGGAKLLEVAPKLSKILHVSISELLVGIKEDSSGQIKKNADQIEKLAKEIISLSGQP